MMFDPKIDPYETIQELQDVCALLDNHIKQLLDNQQQIVNAINELNNKIDLIEEIVNEAT